MSELWNKPKKLYERVRITDPAHLRYGEEGFKFAVRISDSMVMVYFPVTKMKGHVGQFSWNQVQRI